MAKLKQVCAGMCVCVFPDGSVSKEPACQCRRPRILRFNPWVEKSPGEGNGHPLQYSCLETSMGRGAHWSQRVGHD